MANEKKERYCELLIVKEKADGTRHVVKAPTNEAHIGYLVEFGTDKFTFMGTVEDKMWCVVDDERYRCMSLMNPIYALKKIYCPHWKLEEDPDWETA